MSLQVVSDKPVDPVLYINDARYASLWALWHQLSSRDQESDPDATTVAVRLINREARLLDDRHYDDWLNLFAPECVYWVPRKPEPGDPRTESAIYLDDRRRMADRIAVIRTGYLHAQTPASRTCRTLSGIEAWTMPGGRLAARANVVIWEYRKGVTHAHPGLQVYEFTSDARGAQVIESKIVSLLDCDGPQGNYSFML